MIRTQQLITNPNYNPLDLLSQRFIWEYKDAGRKLQPGDVVQFTCTGRGRGGHYSVTALVTKVNRKTFKATELPRSYSPGTLWVVDLDDEENPVYIDLSWKQ